MKKVFYTIIALVALFSTNCFAQKNIIDEVIWIVGDEVILRSEVEAQRLQAQYDNTPIVGDPYCVIPENIAIQKLYIHQAQLDSINVSESMVTSEVERRLNYYMSQIGSKEKMEEYFNKSTNQIREQLRDVVYNQYLVQQMQQKLVGSVAATPADVRRYYKDLKADSVPTVPQQVELQILSFTPPVPQEEISRIKERLRGFADRVNNGNADFSVLARLYSEDTESAKRGGELGFMGKGQLVPEFAQVAFNLIDPKKVSRIVETEYGYHIIQLIEKRGDRINCRHILLKPHVSLSDKEKAVHNLDSIANLIRSNKITFEQAVVYYSQDKNSVMNAGLMMNEKSKTGSTSKFELQDLPAEVAKIVYNMNVGEISKPFLMMDEKNNKEIVAVVKLKSKNESHKANIVDDYQLIKSMYEQKKQEEILKKWIAKKQKETYISIDPAWQKCEFQYPGWIKK